MVLYRGMTHIRKRKQMPSPCGETWGLRMKVHLVFLMWRLGRGRLKRESGKDVRRTTAYNSVTKLFYFENKENSLVF